MTPPPKSALKTESWALDKSASSSWPLVIANALARLPHS